MTWDIEVGGGVRSVDREIALDPVMEKEAYH
jgi:hypothetical protein